MSNESTNMLNSNHSKHIVKEQLSYIEAAGSLHQIYICVCVLKLQDQIHGTTVRKLQ